MGLLRCYSNKIFSGGNVKCSGCDAGVLFAWVVVLGILCSVVAGVKGFLPLKKTCGDFECQELHYCDVAVHRCYPCKDVCDSENPNFQHDRCEQDCQDYIHDERYHKLENATVLELERAEMEEKYKNLEKDVNILKIAVGISVAVIIIVVACLLAFIVYFYKLMHPTQVGSPGEKKKSLSNKPSGNGNVELPTIYNNRYGVTTPTPENSPSSVISTSPVDTNVSGVTTSTRVPPYEQAVTPPAPPRSSPTKSVSSSIATPATASTLMSGSVSSTLVNGGSRSGTGTVGLPKTNRFRREPSESTIPDHLAYDNLSMSPQHMPYSHHV